MVKKIQGTEGQGGGATEEQAVGVSEKGVIPGGGVVGYRWYHGGGCRSVLARGEKERSGRYREEVEEGNVRYRRRMEGLRKRYVCEQVCMADHHMIMVASDTGNMQRRTIKNFPVTSATSNSHITQVRGGERGGEEGRGREEGFTLCTSCRNGLSWFHHYQRSSREH